MSLKRIWLEARGKRFSVNLDTDNYLATIYKGVKLMKRGDKIRIYSTETDFYKDITDSFVNGSFDNSLNLFLKNKYVRNLEKIENLIRIEISGNKNHKRYDYLKSMRNQILKKYNEINITKA